MEVVPLVQTYGHLEWLLKRKAWARLRCGGNVNLVCPQHPEIRQLIEAWLGEVARLHPSARYIHVGLDEVYHMGQCPACRTRAEGSPQGVTDVLLEHARFVCEAVVRQGKCPIVWGDMFRECPENGIGSLPPETVICDWKYRGSEGSDVPRLRAAGMGINTVQLYTEDVYTLPDEPFFGYARGAYTPKELRTIDEYGNRLGMEVISCIQTLGHLEQILQWPAYETLADTSRVLLAEHGPTYALLEKKLDLMSSCFSTRKIHIGMDEAHGIGLGRYRQLYGEKRAFVILSNHLKRVTSLCTERGLSPMMWSDMFFRIGSVNHDYYDVRSEVPADVIEHIPQEVALVYWDYYHEEPSFYHDWIERHRRMGKEPILATGAWTWGRFWACMDRVVLTNSAGMAAARKQGLRDVFITAWGDDGAECHPASMLAGIQYFAEFAYNETPDPEALEKLFTVGTGGSYSGYVTASEVDTIPRIKGCPLPDANFGKWILWHDPVLGFLAPQIPKEIPQHYHSLAERLALLAENDRSEALRFPALLAQVLAGKARLHLEVRAHYQSGNTTAIRALLDEVLAPTITTLKSLWKLHQEVWNEWYKPFGREVIEARYATVCARLEHLGEMLSAYLKDPSIRYDEFEYDLQRIYPEESYPQIYFNYRRTITPSAIS